MKKILFAFSLLLVVQSALAQRGYRDSNHFGIIAGVNQANLNTDNFKADAALGFNLGLSVRGNFYNNFDMVYAIQFFEGKFDVPTISTSAMAQDVELKIQGVQISLMPSYKIVENHLSIEAGPMLQVNGKLKYKKDFEDNSIDAFTTIKELEKVSTFNIIGAVGLTAGIRNLRANFQYGYGFNNFLSSVKNSEGTKFKGNLNILSANLIVYF